MTWPPSGSFIIGAGLRSGAGTSYYSGQISLTQVWNSALTSAQIGSPGSGIASGVNSLVDGSSGFTSIAVGDLNNDGKQDLVGLTSTGNVYDIPNNAHLGRPEGGGLPGPARGVHRQIASHYI